MKDEIDPREHDCNWCDNQALGFIQIGDNDPIFFCEEHQLLASDECARLKKIKKTENRLKNKGVLAEREEDGS